MFACETSQDPLLARSDKLIRCGGGVAPIGLCLIAMTARILDPSKRQFDAEMIGLLSVGQSLVWWGMRGVRRSKGWGSGVVSYVWAGGVMNGWAVAFTGIFLLIPIPLLAPIVATFARWRMARDARRAASGAEAAP